MKKILQSNLYSLSMLLGLSLILINVTNHYILTIGFFDKSGYYLSGIPDQEIGVYDAVQQYIYIAAILYTILKLLIIALIIYTALYLAGHEITFAKAFNIVIWAEYIFLFADFLKVIWFKLEYPNGTFNNWHKLHLFSMASVFGNISGDWQYSLQTLNLFEACYWFVLALGIQKSTRLSYDGALKVVVSSYVPALLIWVVTITFCAIMISPLNS